MKRKILAGVIFAGVICASGTALADVKSSSLIDGLKVSVTIGKKSEIPKDLQGQNFKRPPKFASKDRPPEPPDGKRPPMSRDKKPHRPRSGDKRPPEGFNGKKPELPKNISK